MTGRGQYSQQFVSENTRVASLQRDCISACITSSRKNDTSKIEATHVPSGGKKENTLLQIRASDFSSLEGIKV